MESNARLQFSEHKLRCDDEVARFIYRAKKAATYTANTLKEQNPPEETCIYENKRERENRSMGREVGYLITMCAQYHDGKILNHFFLVSDMSANR